MIAPATIGSGVSAALRVVLYLVDIRACPDTKSEGTGVEEEGPMRLTETSIVQRHEQSLQALVLH